MADNNSLVNWEGLKYYDSKMDEVIKDIHDKLGAGGYTIDSELSEISESAVQNKVITQEFNKKIDKDNVSNPNLLINPDFKINQRGELMWNYGNDLGHCVDRWKTNSGSLSDSGILVKGTAYLVQELEGDFRNLPLVLSVVQADGKMTHISFVTEEGEWFYNTTDNDLFIEFGHKPQSNSYVSIHPLTNDTTIKYAKLELGSVATQFVPPNPLTEKIKCGIPDDTSEYGYRDAVNADIAEHTSTTLIGTNSEVCKYSSILDWANNNVYNSWAFVLEPYGYPTDTPLQHEAVITLETEQFDKWRKIVTWKSYSGQVIRCRTIFNGAWHSEWYNPADGGNAATLDGKLVTNFVENYLHNNYRFLIAQGDHAYITNAIDTDIPNLPAVSNYMHIIGRNSDEKVKVVLSIGIDYTKNVYVYQTGSWIKINDGGNADTLDGFHAQSFLKANATTSLTTSINATDIATGTYSVEASYTPDFPTGYGTYGLLDIRVYGSIIYQTIYFDTGVVIYRAQIINVTEWTTWRSLSDGGNANTVGGYTIAPADASSAGIVTVNNAFGVTEIGRYLDFHTAAGQDFAARIHINDDGTFGFSNTLVANISGNAGTAGNADTVDNVHISASPEGNTTHWAAVFVDAANIKAIPQSSMSVGNADTVDGLHGYQLGTLDASGNSHGTAYPLYCKYNHFGDGRFGLYLDTHETRVNYATMSNVTNYALYADTIAQTPSNVCLRNISAGTDDLVAGTTPLATGTIHLVYE